MDIIGALKQEESKLERQLTAVQGAIAALNGRVKTAVSPGHGSSPRARWTLSASARAKMSRAAKLRWAKIRSAKARKAK